VYCSQCGAKAAGKFCSDCGAPLLSVVREPEPDVDTEGDWSHVVDYQALLRVPQVRQRVARAAAQAKKRMSGEEILDMYGAALGKLGGVSLPMGKLAPYVQAMWAKLGVKTGKSRSQWLAVPPGNFIVELLCWLARGGHELRSVDQLADGCVLRAALPSDLFALEGDLIVAVRRQAAGVWVEAATDIPGQYFDWGKSTRCLERMFSELASASAA